jgi:hypothetical protein
MEEEVTIAFASLEGVSLADFDPASLGMNVSKDAGGGFVVTVPPRGARRASAPVPYNGAAPAGDAERSLRGASAAGAALLSGNRGTATPPGGLSLHGASDFGAPGTPTAGEGSVRSAGSSIDNSRHGPTELQDLRSQLARVHQRAAISGGDSGGAAPASPGRQGGNGMAARPPLAPSALLSPAALAATNAAAAQAAHRDRRSFVARLRDPETGALSNLRLFGGNVGASTAMTRSIGDAGAARCCIAEPEFCTQLVAPTQARDALCAPCLFVSADMLLPLSPFLCAQRARLIIASDGLWDVYANEEAEQLSRGTRLDAPRTSAECATLLASRALEDRAFDGLAADDITALVVDIRGGGLAAAGGPSGACCTVM